MGGAFGSLHRGALEAPPTAGVLARIRRPLRVLRPPSCTSSSVVSPRDSCCVEVTVHLVGGSLSSLPAVLWRCVNVRGFLIRLHSQTGPKAEAAPLCLTLARSLSPFPPSFCPFYTLLCLSPALFPSAFSSSQHNKPLYSFEDNADYVYDVMWSPVHPAMFAAVDGMGRLDLWNLNNDTEVGACCPPPLSNRNWTEL